MISNFALNSGDVLTLLRVNRNMFWDAICQRQTKSEKVTREPDVNVFFFGGLSPSLSLCSLTVCLPTEAV